MKKKVLFIVVLLSISVDMCGANTNDKWVIVCKVWGILKYHAPSSEKKAKNRVDWDKVFLDSFDSIEKCENKIQLNVLIEKWIEKAGKYKDVDFDKNDESYIDNINNSWINEIDSLESELKFYLNNLRFRKNRRENFYVSIEKGKAPTFSREIQYKNLATISKPYRMLSLFRFWNIIDVFYPYKYVMADKWDKQLPNFVIFFLREQSKKEFLLNINKMGHYLEDGHFGVVNFEKKDKQHTLPFMIATFDNHILVKSVFNTDGIQRGDKIIEINGKSIDKIRDSLKMYFSYSNVENLNFYTDIWLYNNEENQQNMYKIVRNLRDTLSFKVSNITFDEWKNYASQIKLNQAAYEILENNIGLIRLWMLKDSEINTAMQQLKNTKAIIIDISKYPQISEYEKFISYFIDKKQINYLRVKAMNKNKIGIFQDKSMELSLPSTAYKYQGKVIVLTSSFGTQSYGETVGTLLKVNTNAIFVGQKSSCTNGSTAKFVLPDSTKITFTSVWIGFPDGNLYKSKGLVPNIVVNLDEVDTLNSVDSRLKKSLEYLNKN